MARMRRLLSVCNANLIGSQQFALAFEVPKKYAKAEHTPECHIPLSLRQAFLNCEESTAITRQGVSSSGPVWGESYRTEHL